MNFLDKMIAWVDPGAGLKRAAHRSALNVVRGYDGATKGRRMNDMRATNSDANAEIQRDLYTLRNRARDMVRNNPYAKRAVQGLTNNIIGKGIVPTPDDLSRSAEKKLMKVWKKWAGKTRCDYDKMLTFYGIQKLVVRTVVQSGECLVVKRRENDTFMPISLQVLEPDYIDSSKNNFVIPGSGNVILHGIEFDRSARRVAYWLYSEHPGGERMYRYESKRVLVEDIAHIYVVERPGQMRGVTWLHASMLRLKDFDDYEDAELVRQKIAACYTVFVSDVNGEDLNNKEDIDIASRIEPGAIEILPPGKTVQFAQPPVTQGYDSYSRKILQGISAGIGVTYEMLTGDLSNVNFSSGRMGWIEFQRNISDWQEDMVITMLCDRVWEWFIEGCVMTGKAKPGTEASWTPPRREMIDPVKETEALKQQVRNGFISFREAVRQLGYDPESVLEEIQKHNDDMDSRGIILDSDPRVGQTSPAMEEDEPHDGPVDENGDPVDENGDPVPPKSGASPKRSATKPATKKPVPAPAAAETDAADPKILKALIDAYGVGVRAGTITPTQEDEVFMRNLMKLPGLNAAATAAWKEDGGIRRPITIKQEEPAPPQP